MNSHFKECPHCHLIWPNRNEFLSDPVLTLIGYQVNYGKLEAGFFMFNHETSDCGTTLAVEAGEFTDMHHGPIFEERRENIKDCPRYCDHKYALDACDTKCECSYVRDVLQQVKNWPKTPIAEKQKTP